MARSDAFVHGYVVGIAVSSRGDGDDTNALPDAVPAPVKITFTRLRGQYAHPLPTPDDAGAHGMFVLHDRVVCDVIPSGEHVGHLTSDLTDGKATATSTPGVWLITGQYRVSAAGHFPEFDIDVTAEHTPAAPLDLYSAVPYIPPPGATVQLVPLPPGGSPGQYLTPLVGGGHGWADAPNGDGGTGGTTDHALLTNRDAADQHPIAAISGLEDALADFSDVVRTDDPRLSDPRPPTEHNHDGTYVKPADLPAPQTWDTLPGKPPVIAAGTSATAARDAIGAGTSNLTLGTGPTTAAAGNHTHDDRYYTESEVDTALAGKAATSHTHGVADLSGVVKTVNGTEPDEAGNVVVSGGGGGEGMGQSTPAVGTYFLSPWLTGGAIDKPVSVLTGYAFVPVPSPMTIDTVSIFVHTGQSGATGGVEVYAATAGLGVGALVTTLTGADLSTGGRKDFTWSHAMTGPGLFFLAKSTVGSVRLLSGAPVGPGAGIGNGSPTQTMPASVGQYPGAITTGPNPRTEGYVPMVMLRRSA